MTLAEYRYNLGLTPEELGLKVGVSGRTIRRYEAGEKRPGPATAKRLTDFIQEQAAEAVTPLELFPHQDVAA